MVNNSSCTSSGTLTLPKLQPSCSPEASEEGAELTRWQRLRSLAQTKSLLSSATLDKTIAAFGGHDIIHIASSPVDLYARPAVPHHGLGVGSRQPGQLASARARSLLQCQDAGAVTDSLDTDLQVEAVLRKAAGRAVCQAGLPRAPASHSKVLANLSPNSLRNDQSEGSVRLRYPVLRDVKNDMSSDRKASKQPVHSKGIRGSTSAGNAASDIKQHERDRGRQVPSSAAARQQSIMQALSKQRLRQMSAWFAAWLGITREGQVHLKGAGSMLKWRKLLRIWKAWRHVVATCQAVKQAQLQARQAHLQDIATTFHMLFRQHSVMQAWHAVAQHTTHERTQTQQAAAEQQRDQAKWAAAVQFHGLYTQHSFWRCWLEVAQQGRIEKELELQHQTRQHSIQQFVKEAVLRQQKQPERPSSSSRRGPACKLRRHQMPCSASNRQPGLASISAHQHSQQLHPSSREDGHQQRDATLSQQQPQVQQHKPKPDPVSQHCQDGTQACAKAAADTCPSHGTGTVLPTNVCGPGLTSAHHGIKSPACSLAQPEAADTAAAEVARPAESQLELVDRDRVESLRQPNSEGVVLHAAHGSCVSSCAQGAQLSMSDSAECRLLCEPSGATGQACQHTRPSSLLMHANQAEDEAAQTEGQQDQPCTPGHQQGEVQEQPCTPGLVVTSSACCALPRSCSSTGGDSAGSGLEAENSIRFRKRSKFEALKARREAAHQKAEAKQREQEEFVRRAECIRKLEARQKQEEEAAVKALGQQLLAHQSALAHIQYARTVARDKGWRPWQHLMQQAHCRMVTAQQWAQTKAVQHAFR
ncbi:TPA: hypothetical protein ACH3X2_001569 [Trebouxia sp. C0005]